MKLNTVLHFLCFLFQAKALILLPTSIAVHSATSGKMLWQNSLEKKDNNREKALPFITRDIAGCFHVAKNDENDLHYEVSIHIYNTQSGEHISDLQIELIFPDHLERYGVFARGSYLCYIDSGNLLVHKVMGKDVQEHIIPFPIKHLLKTNSIFSSSVDYETLDNAFHFRDCLGFVGKSNVLLLKFQSYKCGSFIASLDLDDYLSAKSEEEKISSFLLPLAAHCSPCSPHMQGYQPWHPVYETDTFNGCVDIVGIMRMSIEENEMQTLLENFFFVTKLELPK